MKGSDLSNQYTRAPDSLSSEPSKSEITLEEVKALLRQTSPDIGDEEKSTLEELVLSTCPKAGQGVNN